MKDEARWTKAFEWACSDERLSPTDFRVYIAIRIRAGDEGSCWESVGTIASRAGNMSERSAQRSLVVLKSLGYIIESPNRGKKTHREIRIAKFVAPPPTNLAERGDKSVAPPPTNLAERGDKSVVPPPTNLSPNQEHGSRSGSRIMMTIERSSSSITGMTQDSEELEETDAESETRVVAGRALAMAFPGNTLERNNAVIGKYGAENVAYAVKVYRPKDRMNEWGWFLGICRNTKADGGPPDEPKNVLPSKTKPMTYHVAPPRPNRVQPKADLNAAATTKDSTALNLAAGSPERDDENIPF